MSAPTPEARLLSTLGLCARARKLVMGTPMVCEALRKGGKTPVLAVLEASDTSENTHGKLTSKCRYYRVPLYRLTATTAELARAVGKTGAVAAVGLTDGNLLRALTPSLPEAEATEEREPTPSQTDSQPSPEGT